MNLNVLHFIVQLLFLFTTINCESIKYIRSMFLKYDIDIISTNEYIPKNTFNNTNMLQCFYEAGELDMNTFCMNGDECLAYNTCRFRQDLVDEEENEPYCYTDANFDSTDLKCINGYFKYLKNIGCVAIAGGGKNFSEQQSLCRKKRGELLITDSYEFLQTLEDFYNASNYKPSGGFAIRIGLVRVAGKWQWLNGLSADNDPRWEIANKYREGFECATLAWPKYGTMTLRPYSCDLGSWTFCESPECKKII